MPCFNLQKLHWRVDQRLNAVLADDFAAQVNADIVPAHPLVIDEFGQIEDPPMLQKCQARAVELVIVLRDQQTVTKARGHCQPLRAIEAQDQAHGLMRPLFGVLFALHVRRVEVLLNAGDTERAPCGAVLGICFCGSVQRG